MTSTSSPLLKFSDGTVWTSIIFSFIPEIEQRADAWQAEPADSETMETVVTEGPTSTTLPLCDISSLAIFRHCIRDENGWFRFS